MAELIDIIAPESDQEGTESFMERWFKQPGEYVEQYEPLLELNTDKVTIEVPAPAGGVLKEILKRPNEPVAPGEVLGRIEIAEKAQVKTVVAAGAKTGAGVEEKETGEIEAPATAAGEAAQDLSPAVRRMLRQHGIAPAQIRGTGRGGRITLEDVETYLAGRQTAPLRQAQDKPAPAPTPDTPSRNIPHTPIRLRTARHMVESMLQTAPHVTAVFDADLSAVIAHREANQAAFAEKGIKLTYTAYFVIAAAKALQALPEVNSRWREDALEIFQDCNIGIAAATESGLVVPVIHRAQTLDLFGVAGRLQDLTDRAREGKLAQPEVQNGTFTITNHGMTGSLIATPIIHQPQSAILGIGKLEKRVVAVEKKGKDVVEIKPMVYVTLTIDHRALDGFQANRFLTEFVQTLENWPLH